MRLKIFTIVLFCLNSICITKAMTIESRRIFINNEIDLQGLVYELPPHSTLIFKGDGLIRNGIIIGNQTKIKAKDKTIFTNVTISGTWLNETVYANWFPFDQTLGFDNKDNFINTMRLCEGDLYTHLYMPEGTFYTSTQYDNSHICIPSNTYWHNSATICEIPNQYSKSSLVLLDRVSNVTIDGGRFIGDVKNHMGIDGEWGHGIKCSGVLNVNLCNLECSEFWGDGVDLIEGKDVHGAPSINCQNVKLSNVRCLNNRRQGLSIEAATNVSVVNSEFAYTGQILSTNPSSGVDIEPWQVNDRKIQHIYFENCSFHDNYGYDLHIVPNRLLSDNEFIDNENDIKLIACTIGLVNIGSANGIHFQECAIGENISTLEHRGGYVSSSNLGIIQIYRSNVIVSDSKIVNNIEDAYTILVQNNIGDLDLQCNFIANDVLALKKKLTGNFRYSINVFARNCCMEDNMFALKQGIIIRSTYPQQEDDLIDIKGNVFKLEDAEWKAACITLRSSNKIQIFNQVHIFDNDIEGFHYILANDNNTHIIKYSGKSHITLEQFKSGAMIELIGR